MQPIHYRESAFFGHLSITTKGLSFTLHVLLDKFDEALAKKTIHWSEHWCCSERCQLNTSTVFHLPESKIKERQREKEEREKDNEIYIEKEKEREKAIERETTRNKK